MDSHQHHHQQGFKCSCCSMSRRCFLATAGAAAGAVALAGAAGKAYAADNLGEYVNLADLRPRPKVRITYVIARQTPPYWLGWPGTSYDVEGWRQRYGAEFAEMAKRVGVELNAVDAPIESKEAAEAFINKIKTDKPGAVLIMIQHFAGWEYIKMIADGAGLPTLVFAPIGMCFTTMIDKLSRQNGVHIVSSLETSGVEQAMRMVRAKRQFEETRLLVLRQGDRDEKKLARLGTTIKGIPRDSLPALFAKMPENDEANETAERMMKAAQKVVEPTKQDALNAARSFMAAKRLMVDEQANAITTDCLGMVTQKAVPTPPCMAAAMFQDAGVTYGCEADVDAALSLMLPSYVFDKPGFINDPVPETVKNLLIVAHCVSGTKLNGFDQPAEPFVMRSHSESALGVSLQVLWKEGQPVTLVKFRGDNELILDTGTVVSNVQTPPAGGCRTNFEVLMDRVEDARDVVGFHQVVFYGNHRRQVMDFCQLYGIKVVNSPERTQLPQGDGKQQA